MLGRTRHCRNSSRASWGRAWAPLGQQAPTPASRILLPASLLVPTRNHQVGFPRNPTTRGILLAIQLLCFMQYCSYMPAHQFLFRCETPWLLITNLRLFWLGRSFSGHGQSSRSSASASTARAASKVLQLICPDLWMSITHCCHSHKRLSCYGGVCTIPQGTCCIPCQRRRAASLAHLWLAAQATKNAVYRIMSAYSCCVHRARASLPGQASVQLPGAMPIAQNLTQNFAGLQQHPQQPNLGHLNQFMPQQQTRPQVSFCLLSNNVDHPSSHCAPAPSALRLQQSCGTA